LGEREGAEWVVREGWGQGGEMTQALHAHMNNKTIKKRNKVTSGWGRAWNLEVEGLGPQGMGLKNWPGLWIWEWGLISYNIFF
jgi:hypothetical protein